MDCQVQKWSIMEPEREQTRRPLTAKGVQTQQRIVAAAADLMVANGVAGVSLDEVGRATSTSKSQIYHYFSNKEALTTAVVENVGEGVVSFQAELLGSFESLDDLDRWADGIIAFQRAQPKWCGCPLGTLASELAGGAGPPQEAVDKAFVDWESMLENGLTRLQSAGILQDDADPRRLAIATLVSLQGGLLMAKAVQDAAPLEVALAAAIDHIRSFASAS
jgi:AcrR family transcriptional regulator